MEQVQEGGCHCGAVRYKVRGELDDVAHCHCSVCRRVTGGLLVSWVTVPNAAFEWQEQKKSTLQRYDSSESCVRYLCSRCGTHMALTTELSPETIDITVGSLDRPEDVQPKRHIWTSSRLPWLHLDESLPQEPGETL